MQVDVRIERDTVEGLFDRGGEVTRRELTRAVWEAELLLLREVQERTPTASGLLRQSITAGQPLQLASNVIGLVGTSIGHAAAVELGTKPHWAPIEPLIDWVVQRGLTGEDADGDPVPPEAIARLIQFKIAAHGTKGHYMFADTYLTQQRQVQQILERGVQRAVRALDGGGA